MKEINNVINTIATTILLNEFLGRIIPGAILLSAMIPNMSRFRHFFNGENDLDRILFWGGISWTLGYVIEYLSYKLRIGKETYNTEFVEIVKEQKYIGTERLKRAIALKNVFGNTFASVVFSYGPLIFF